MQLLGSQASFKSGNHGMHIAITLRTGDLPSILNPAIHLVLGGQHCTVTASSEKLANLRQRRTRVLPS